MKKIRQPRQQRSIQTKERIMKAAFQLFSQKGIHGTNSKEIVDRAGVSIGSFYSYFKDKRKLLLEILEDHCDTVFTSIWQPLSSRVYDALSIDDIRLLIESVFEAYKIAPEFHRQTHALRYSDPEINRVYERERKREIAQIRLLLEENAGGRGAADFYTAAVMIHNLVESVMHTYMFLGPEIEKQKLVEQLSIMVQSYVDVLDKQPAIS